MRWNPGTLLASYALQSLRRDCGLIETRRE
jgi:hypothetical protein